MTTLRSSLRAAHPAKGASRPRVLLSPLLKSQWRLQFAAVATCLLFSGCGSSPQQNSPPVSDAPPDTNYYVGKRDVYAHLESGSGGSWIFGELTASNLEPTSGFLVRLNDLAPAFDTRIAECTPQAYPTNHKCNPLHPFREKKVGVIGKIISGGIAAGTAGKVTDVGRNYETSFDETTFNQAVDEALVNTGLDSTRKDFLTMLERYEVTLAESRLSIDEQKRARDVAYQDTGSVELDIQINVTGLSEYYSNDLERRDLIELVPHASGEVDKQAIAGTKLLPCDAMQCAQNARSALATLQADVENIKMRLAHGNTPGQNVYDVRCDKTAQAGYLFTLECPPQIARADAGQTPLPVTLNILARDFEDLYPGMEIADENLRITIGGNEVSFTNLTPDYVSVLAQTVYYNSQVQTNATNISVAPGATIKRVVSDFVSPAIIIESSYRQMTPDKALGTSFRFGFAANYRVAGTVNDTTLHEVRSFNVACVIDNRVRPGSCKHLPADDLPLPDLK